MVVMRIQNNRYECGVDQSGLSLKGDKFAYGDLADATVTAVAATRISPEKKPESKLHYGGPGVFWVEGSEEKPFNWPHIVPVEE